MPKVQVVAIFFALIACAPARAPQDDEVVAVALAASDSVAFFSSRTLARVATIAVGRHPHELTASTDNRLLYVANTRDSTISVIEMHPTPRVARTWRLPGISVHDVAVAADGMVWGASGDPSVIVAIDASSGEVRRTHAMQRPGAWMLDARGPDDRIVVANLEGGAVTLLRPASGEQLVLPGAEGEIDAIATPDRTQIWSVNVTTGDLTVFDAQSGSVIAKEKSGPQAVRVIFTPAGDRALVVHGGDSTVVAYDVATRRRVGVARVPGVPKVIAMTPDGRHAYVTIPQGALAMIEVASMTVVRTVQLSGTPDGVAVLARSIGP